MHFTGLSRARHIGKIRLVNRATSLSLLNLETAILDGSFVLEQQGCSIFSKDHTHTTTRSLDDQPFTCSAFEDQKGGISVQVAISRKRSILYKKPAAN